MSLTKSIAAWAAGVTWQDVPTRAQEHARNDLRDVLSVMFAGTLTTSARIAAQYARASPRRGDRLLRPMGQWSPAVHEYLRHLEAAGLDGAPRLLGSKATAKS